MTATPGHPEDWADTNPETAEPERILPIPEGVTPAATKVAMACYAVGAAAKCWEYPERAGAFDSERASQIVTELCEALGVEQQGRAAPVASRPEPLSDEQASEAPGQPDGVCGPQEPVLPRQVKPEDVRPGMVIETRTAWEVTSRIVNGRFNAVESSGGVNMGRRCEVWLIEDAPEPVDPDAAAIEAIITAYRRSPECSTHAVFGEAMLDHLRAQGFDVTARAEQ